MTGGAVESAFGEKTIETAATADAAVIGNVAHVIQEISLRTEASDRAETVCEEEVELESGRSHHRDHHHGAW